MRATIAIAGIIGFAIAIAMIAASIGTQHLANLITR